MSRLATVREDTTDSQFARDVLTGLAQPQKTIPCTWLYDLRGSELFEQITGLPEYYPTRSELSILRAHLPEFGRQLGKHASVMEIGAGSSRKTRLLLAALREPYAYLPVDISAQFLFDAVRGLQEDFPQVRCTPLVVDFTVPAALLQAGQQLAGIGPNLGFFPGSTIGNFAPAEAVQLLAVLGRALGERSTLVVGIDSTSDPAILLPAYDDAQRVTAAFNLNLLARINRELEANFKLDTFVHEARFNAAESRIEMHLVSRLTQRVSVLGRTYVFQAGETIHTENSHKFRRARFLELVSQSGWTAAQVWTHDDSGFEVHVLRRGLIQAQPLHSGD